MNRIILTAAAVAFTVVLVAGTEIQANGPKNNSRPVAIQGGTIHRDNGHNINFRDRSFRGWNSYCYFGQHRCYGYFCPTAQAWFYWYAPMQRYLPISLMAIYPPTPFAGVPPVGINPIAPVGAGLPALPPGAAPVNLPPASPVGEPLPMVP